MAKLEDFTPAARVAAGLTIYVIADTLAGMSAEAIAALGVRMAAEATGWMEIQEVAPPMSMEDVDFAAQVLLERLQSAAAWEEEMGDEPG